jgi:hypothetical protein
VSGDGKVVDNALVSVAGDVKLRFGANGGVKGSGTLTGGWHRQGDRDLFHGDGHVDVAFNQDTQRGITGAGLAAHLAESGDWIIKGDVDYRIPGGESRADLAARGRAMLEKLAARDVPSMIVVAHGGILTAALGSLLGPAHPVLAVAAMRPFTKLPALANASLTVLEWPGPVLHRFNDTDHLVVT